MIYVGKAINLKKRVSSYFKTKDLGEKTNQLVSQINKIKIIPVSSELDAFLLEERLIKKYKPKYNLKLQDDKYFFSVKITIKDKYPKIFLVRKELEDGSKYFGPYTNSSSLKTTLKIIRKIFPYQNVINHPNKLCFYNHLGLCPCPYITKDSNYKKNIKYIINFLNGNTNKIVKQLEKERDSYSYKEDFEQAKIIQNKINAINNISLPIHKPREYEENPNLKFDVINNQLNQLKDILNTNKIFVRDLIRIEAFDISNISGKHAVGSMVVFINGEKNTSLYRRFKIKGDYNDKPNDFIMLQEIIERRLKRKEWQTPSLIIIDGGKGQVSSVLKVLKKLEFNIPIIGLAKREETIISSNLNEIKLAKNSTPLLLIMRIRDEAHRFAITYHKKIRSKSIFS